MNVAKRTDPDDIRLCNCANCGRELLAPDDANIVAWNKLSNAARARLPFATRAGKVDGRPYCKGCLTAVYLTSGRSADTGVANRGGLTPRQAAKKTP